MDLTFTMLKVKRNQEEKLLRQRQRQEHISGKEVENKCLVCTKK